MWKKVLSQPLLHFLVIGACIFAAYGLFAPDGRRSGDAKEVVVGREELLRYLQYRTKKFNETQSGEVLNALSDEAIGKLVDAYVQEEVLYREGLALGLARNDYVIRQRLIQKAKFITQGFMEATTEVSEAELAQYFEQNKAEYFEQPSITFTHVYFSAEARGWPEARAEAQRELARLKAGRVPFANAVGHGDRFLYNLNYVERVPDYVASHFGQEMSDRLFAVAPDASAWVGPFNSPYGVHLVMVTDRREGRTPRLEEIRGRVLEDARGRKINRSVDEAVAKIIGSYDVDVRFKREAPAANTAKVLEDASPGRSAGGS